MKVGSLFSGIEGFGYALEKAGCSVEWQVENAASSIQVLKYRYPDVIKHEDVRDCHSLLYLDSLVRTWYPVQNEQEEIMAGKLKKLTPEQAEESIRLYEKGLSLQLIASYYGVTRQSMWDYLRRRITLRSNLKYGEENHFYRGGTKQYPKANDIAEYAIKKGILINPGKCQECGDSGICNDGRSKIQAHHPDYNKPLDVMWLCPKCHYEWHENNEPKRKRSLGELAAVDIICGGFP